jgi:hypothetical protein
MSWRRLLGAALLIAATIVLAPLLYGVGKGLAAGGSDEDRAGQSFALLAAYREQSPPEVSIPYYNFNSDIRRCGYDEQALFPTPGPQPDIRDPDVMPYAGYFTMLGERGAEQQRLLDRVRADTLTAGTSAFSSEFLRVCLRHSVFASACALRVGSLLSARNLNRDSGVWPSAIARPDLGQRDRSICLYLDGVAARRGLPLAARAQ